MEAESSKTELNQQLPRVPIHLELGDWVYERGEVSRELSPAMYVVGIWDNGVYLELDTEQGDPFEADYRDIVPIPLTDDIIAKNRLNMHIIKEYGQYKFIIHRSNIPVRFVHELQHLLRMFNMGKEIYL